MKRALTSSAVAMLYSLTGPAGSFDSTTGIAPKAERLFVIYLPNATVASSGLPATPTEGLPWIMVPALRRLTLCSSPGCKDGG